MTAGSDRRRGADQVFASSDDVAIRNVGGKAAADHQTMAARQSSRDRSTASRIDHVPALAVKARSIIRFDGRRWLAPIANFSCCILSHLVL